MKRHPNNSFGFDFIPCRRSDRIVSMCIHPFELNQAQIFNCFKFKRISSLFEQISTENQFKDDFPIWFKIPYFSVISYWISHFHAQSDSNGLDVDDDDDDDDIVFCLSNQFTWKRCVCKRQTNDCKKNVFFVRVIEEESRNFDYISSVSVQWCIANKT